MRATVFLVDVDSRVLMLYMYNERQVGKQQLDMKILAVQISGVQLMVLTFFEKWRMPTVSWLQN